MWHYVTTDGYNWAPPWGSAYYDNAHEIWNFLVTAQGWTENSASAVIGNMQVESFLNPGQWQLNQNYDMQAGFGLGQWDPATKVSNFIGSTDKDAMADGTKQLMLLISKPGQYSTYFLHPDGSAPYYNETGIPYISNMADFSQSNASITDLAKLWAICWERPGDTAYANSKNDRISNSQYWFNEFHGTTPTPPTPPEPPTPEEATAMLIMFMIGRRRRPPGLW